MAYILDGILLLIVVVTVALGYHRGFIRSVVQLVGLIAAVVIASSLSASVSTMVYDSFVSEPLQNKVVEAVENAGSGLASERLDSALESLPPFLVNAINQNDQATQALDQLQNTVVDSTTALAQAFVTNVIRPLAIGLFRVVAFILLVILLLLLVKLLTKLIKPVTKLPVIRQADGLLGGAIGLVKAVFFVFIAVSVMQLLASSGKLVTMNDLQETFLASWIAQNSPISLI
ncbi:MAG: CvpA family protein [Clostridia bacterium]|nr:CvpA family protein [Clostridia bacterium]